MLLPKLSQKKQRHPNLAMASTDVGGPSEAACVVSAAAQAKLGPGKCPAGEAGAAAVETRPDGDAAEPKAEEEEAASLAASVENNVVDISDGDGPQQTALPSPPPQPRVGPRFQAEVPPLPLGSPPAPADEARDPRAALPGPSPRTAVALAAGAELESAAALPRDATRDPAEKGAPGGRKRTTESREPSPASAGAAAAAGAGVGPKVFCWGPRGKSDVAPGAAANAMGVPTLIAGRGGRERKAPAWLQAAVSPLTFRGARSIVPSQGGSGGGGGGGGGGGSLSRRRRPLLPSPSSPSLPLRLEHRRRRRRRRRGLRRRARAGEAQAAGDGGVSGGGAGAG